MKAFIEFDIRCKACGTMLTAEFVKRCTDDLIMTVDPCLKCEDDAIEKGYNKYREDHS